MALVVGEFKAVAPAVDGFKLWIRHMPDAPLLADLRTWPRIARRFAPLFDALDADGGFRPRLIVASLICAPREGVCAIDSASAEGMAAFDHWTRRRGRPLHAGVRLGLVFSCALIHGLGLAGALAELTQWTPGSAQLALALVDFNLGIEAAQVGVAALAVLLTLGLGWALKGWMRPAASDRVGTFASAAAMKAGSFWFIERVALSN
jgi:hypothetical protein